MILIVNSSPSFNTSLEDNSLTFGENFFKKFGLKKISYGYQSFSAGNERKSIPFGFNNLNFIPLICYEIIYSGKVGLKSDETDFIINWLWFFI